MTDFSTYELGQNPYDLADGILREIAAATGYTLGEQPTDTELSGLISHLGPTKTLQDNITLVQEELGSGIDATTVVADWIERSGVLIPLQRAFADNEPTPNEFDAVVWSGGVANWILRRTAITERLDPERVGTVTIVAGNRQMREAEHQLVINYARKEGKLPSEADFISAYILGRLGLAGFDSSLLRVDSGNGDQILDELFAVHRSLLDKSVVVPSNAPNAIQAAGQLRLAAKRAYVTFDNTHNQVYMMSDSVPVARRGEGTATHQNPFSALGQIARNALFLHKNQA